jgi:hypothetical protein
VLRARPGFVVGLLHLRLVLLPGPVAQSQLAQLFRQVPQDSVDVFFHVDAYHILFVAPIVSL